MSGKNPGKTFDASNSWSGYNHQGKLVILLAIRELLDKYDTTLSKEKNIDILKNYFLEIEYFEDFSFGKINNGKKEYYCINQVKNYKSDNPDDYEDGLLGLVNIISCDSNIETAYLHVTTNLRLGKLTMTDYVKQLIKKQRMHNATIREITKLRQDDMAREKICERHKGVSDIERKLKECLREANIEDNLKLNLDIALNLLETKTIQKVGELEKLTDLKLSKVNTYQYTSDVGSTFCNVEQAPKLIKKEIIRSVTELKLDAFLAEERFVDGRFGYLLNKIDEHIIERNKDYSLYATGKKDRCIYFDEIYKWLTDLSISTADENFYLYKIKEAFCRYSDEMCSKCLCSPSMCNDCRINKTAIRISRLSIEEMRRFTRSVIPHVSDAVTIETIMEYITKDRVVDPFLRGIKEINKDYSSSTTEIRYTDKKAEDYILTVMVKGPLDDEKSISTQIVNNKNNIEILMDYSGFISRDISFESIVDNDQKISRIAKKNSGEHIAKKKIIKTITLEEFKKMI